MITLWNNAEITTPLPIFIKYYIWSKIVCALPLWFHLRRLNFLVLNQAYSWGTRLTHCGRVTHICVSKLTIIGSDNGLSPSRHQAIIWTNAGILLIGPLGTNFSGILIDIYTFSFTEMNLKMSSGKWRPFYLGLNVLTLWPNDAIWWHTPWATLAQVMAWCRQLTSHNITMLTRCSWYILKNKFHKNAWRVTFETSIRKFMNLLRSPRGQWVNRMAADAPCRSGIRSYGIHIVA